MSKITQYIGLSSADILTFSSDYDDGFIDQDTDIEKLVQSIDFNETTSRFRIFVLYPDEKDNYEIPQEDIKMGGSYNENYQNGQRRSLSFSLYNDDGKYNPNINNLWAGTRIRLEMGLELLTGNTIWFHKGTYVINKISPSLSSSGREVDISASDKFGLFENSTGKLEDSYKIESGLYIKDIIGSILQESMGNGEIFDTKEMIYHPSLEGKKTQVEIAKSAGETFGSILLELATQLSAEIFYNANGNLVVAPIIDVTNDGDKPTLYDFYTERGDISQLDFEYDYNSIVNRIVVVGNSSNGGYYQAIAINNDEASPLCYQRIGYRTGDIINDSNITSDKLAEERAEYELRQRLIIKTTTSTNIMFNPLLTVNNLISITDEFFGLSNQKYLIQSISCGIDNSSTMSISFTNLNNLSTGVEVISALSPRKVPAGLFDYNTISVNLAPRTNIALIGLEADNAQYTDNVFTRSLPFSTQRGAKVYVYGAIDDTLYIPPTEYKNNWERVILEGKPARYETHDKDYAVYKIKFPTDTYGVYGSTGGYINMVDMGVTDFTLGHVYCENPSIKTSLEILSDGSTQKPAAATLFYRKKTETDSGYNSVKLAAGASFVTLNAGEAVNWYAKTESNYKFIKRGGKTISETEIGSASVPEELTIDLTNSTYDSTEKSYVSNFNLTAERIPIKVLVNFVGDPQEGYYNINIPSKYEAIELTIKNKEEGEPDYYFGQEGTTSVTLTGDYSVPTRPQQEWGTYLGEGGKFVFSILGYPAPVEHCGNIYKQKNVENQIFDSADGSFTLEEPEFYPTTTIKVGVGVGVDYLQLHYCNENGEWTQANLTKKGEYTFTTIMMSNYSWTARPEEDYEMPETAGDGVADSFFGIRICPETTGWHRVGKVGTATGSVSRNSSFVVNLRSIITHLYASKMTRITGTLDVYESDTWSPVKLGSVSFTQQLISTSSTPRTICSVEGGGGRHGSYSYYTASVVGYSYTTLEISGYGAAYDLHYVSEEIELSVSAEQYITEYEYYSDEE